MMDFSQVDASFAAFAEEYLKDGGKMQIPISGRSMSPFLKSNRDQVLLKTSQGVNLRKGDIVFYQRDDGQCVMHRIYKELSPEKYAMLGDNQFSIEFPILREQIFAIATEVIRNGKRLTPSSFIWRAYSIFSRKLFIKRIVFRIYRFLKH